MKGKSGFELFMMKFANSVLVLFLLLLLGFQAEAILKYSEHSDSVVSIFFYYILPSLFIVILIFCLRLNKEYKINIAISLVSIGICLSVVDIFFWVSRNYNNVSPYEELSKKKNIPFDSRTRLEVIESFKKKNVVAYPVTYPCLFVRQKNMEIYPLSGVSNSLTVYSNETGEYTIYNSDKYGFHNTGKDIWNPGVSEIGAVGDSFLHGQGVPR